MFAHIAQVSGRRGANKNTPCPEYACHREKQRVTTCNTTGVAKDAWFGSIFAFWKGVFKVSSKDLSNPSLWSFACVGGKFDVGCYQIQRQG